MFSESRGALPAFQDKKPSKAFELFDNKQYVEAEPLFKELIWEEPDSLELYYYYGACRTENKNYSEYDLIQLLNADPAKVPQKLNYYLGIQYQAQENWEQALKHFNKYRMNSAPEEQEQLNIASKIQECYNQENPYRNLVTQVTESSLAKTRTETILPDTLTTGHKTGTETESTSFTPPRMIQKEENLSVSEESGKPIEFIVNSRITYYNTRHFQTEEGRTLFNKSQEKQQRLDSLLAKTDELREAYREASTSALKNIFGEKIVALENELYPQKEEVNNLLLQAQKAEYDYWSTATNNEIEEFIQKSASERQQPEPEETATETVAPDTVLFNPEIFLTEDNNDVLLEEPRQKDELIYRIQIGAYSRGLPAYVERLYKKLSVIRKIDNYTDENGVVVYTTGKLTNLDDAVKMQKQVRQEGVEDAFVVPYFNGKRITLEEAKKIEGEL
ncbi:MAG: hypothetical protein JW761_00605 [Prolixibacteraceae bacterium]|nr:hypothetical protein [Prolixibacteraceae bacterium]